MSRFYMVDYSSGLGSMGDYVIYMVDYMPALTKRFLALILTIFCVLGGCSTVKIQPPVYTEGVVSRDDLLSGKALFGDKASTLVLPEDNVIQLTDQMMTYLDRYVPRNYSENTRVRSLVQMMIGQGILGMEYDPSKTHTAQEAFKKAQGNCLAFSYLFAAFARERGLRVSFQEVQIPPQWDQAGEELYYLSRHINVRVHMREHTDYIVDIDRINFKPHYKSWKITENHAIALYYSNKGADYLVGGDFENAFRYLIKAIKLAPQDSSVWSNLGVLYRLRGLNKYAEKAYFIALKRDRSHRSVLNNLSVLYEQMGEREKAEYYFQLAKEYQMKNPYYRYYQALDAFEQGNYDLALNHLREAVKTRDDEKKFHDLLGATYARLGDDERAEKAWSKARELLAIQ